MSEVELHVRATMRMLQLLPGCRQVVGYVSPRYWARARQYAPEGYDLALPIDYVLRATSWPETRRAGTRRLTSVDVPPTETSLA